MSVVPVNYRDAIDVLNQEFDFMLASVWSYSKSGSDQSLLAETGQIAVSCKELKDKNLSMFFKNFP